MGKTKEMMLIFEGIEMYSEIEFNGETVESVKILNT